MPKWRASESKAKKKPTASPKNKHNVQNVFIDLGFPYNEAVNILARLELMIAIEKIIVTNGWTQQEAAHLLGISQPRVCALMNSNSDKFTVDMLIKLLNRLGKRVTISIEDSDVA